MRFYLKNKGRNMRYEKEARVKLRLIGKIIGLIGYILAFVFYDWRLAVILLITIWANNMELVGRDKL